MSTPALYPVQCYYCVPGTAYNAVLIRSIPLCVTEAGHANLGGVVGFFRGEKPPLREVYRTTGVVAARPPKALSTA